MSRTVKTEHNLDFANRANFAFSSFGNGKPLFFIKSVLKTIYGGF
jgi:hypothetical protein